MNTTTKIAVPATVITAGLIVLKVRSLHADLYEHFPTIDKKIVRQAYRTMMLKAMTDQYEDLGPLDDEAMDQIFLREVMNIRNKK